jgi:hypothetical protein
MDYLSDKLAQQKSQELNVIYRNKTEDLEKEILVLNTKLNVMKCQNEDLQKRLNLSTNHFLSLYKEIHQAGVQWGDANVHQVNYIVQEKLEKIFESTQKLIIAKLKNNCPLTDKEAEHVIDKFNSIKL